MKKNSRGPRNKWEKLITGKYLTFNRFLEELKKEDPDKFRKLHQVSFEAEVARALLAWRVQKGVSQSWIVEKSGVSENSYQRMEGVSGTSPSVGNLGKVVKGLGLESFKEFFEGPRV